MTRRFAPGVLGVGLLLAAVAGAVGAEAIPAEELPEPLLWQLPVSVSVPVSVCPGPQTLLVPDGSRPVPPPGPVVVAAVATGSAVLGGLAAPQAGEAPAPASPTTLGGNGSRDGAAAAGLASVARSTAGGVLFDVARTGPGRPAPAASAVQAGLATDGDLRGLTAASCIPAAPSSWLVAGGSTDGERSRLVLSNPTATPALLDVIVHGRDGVVKAPVGEGIVVPPGGQQALYLEAVAPGLDALAVEVSARTGRVAASLQHSRVLGFTPGGVADVTPSAPPSQTQLVPGVVVAAPGRTSVRVVVPGAEEAVVSIAVVAEDAAAPSAGTEGDSELKPVQPQPIVTTVGPGAVADVPLTDLPDGRYVVVVTTDVPVVAAARITLTADGGELAGTPGALGRTVPPSELAWAASTGPLSGSVAIAVPRFEASSPTTTATLLLAAPVAPARARLREVAQTGAAGAEVDLELAAGTVQLRQLPGSVAAVLIDGAGEPGGGGPLVAALLLQAQDDAGPLLDVVPLLPGPPAEQPAPQVIQDDRLGIGSG